MTVRSSGEHTCTLTFAGLVISATDSEVKVLAQSITRVLHDKGKDFPPLLPDTTNPQN